MKKTYFQRVQEQTPTRFWINNVTRNEALKAIAAGAVGCTQNPSYTWRMIGHEDESKETLAILDDILLEENDDSNTLVRLQRELIGRIGKIFIPMYEESMGKQGFVSIQGDPFKEDADSILRYAKFNREAGVNIMAKIPVTKDGLEAIEILAAEGIPINATEVMAVKQAIDVCEVYQKATKGKKCPAPLYFSHIAGIFDDYLKSSTEREGNGLSRDALWQAGISVAKKIHNIVRERAYSVGFIEGGARALHHFTEMVGADCCVTINWRGTADLLLEQDPPVIQRFLQPTADIIVDELLEKNEDYRKAYLINGISPDEYEHYGPVVHFRTMFETAWSNALDFIKNRRNASSK